jgi:replication factor C subunit 3/5
MKPAEKWWPMIVYFILLMFMYMIQVQGGDFPHLLVYGPSGAGKKTRIMCLLREMYGAGVEKLRIEQHTFTTPSNKKIEISTISSNYHIEVNPR